VALSDLAVFSEYAYSAMTEVQAQNIAVFNENSQGTITLGQGAHQGDYSDKAFFAKIAGLVKRRNAYGTGAQTNKQMTQLVDTMVKIAGGSVPVQMDPQQFKWIQMNPQVAGAALGQQLAGDSMADMLNTAISCGGIALANQAAVTYDGTSAVASQLFLNNTAAKFGDRATQIAAWVLHSKVMFDLWANALTNTQLLFKYGTVAISQDPFGRVYIVTDAPGLTYTSSGTKYRTLGLTQNAITVEQNGDFEDNWDTRNGDENIARTYQSEWTYQLGIKGFTWDKTNGGKSPNDSALQTATNWDKIVTSNKDLAGVVGLSQ
jgi:hypothetical protein